jgi:hypothetical protein
MRERSAMTPECRAVACEDDAMDDAHMIKELLARYYRAHALDDPSLIGDEAFAEPLLQRIFVDELGGDSFEQAFLEGNLLHPEDGYEKAAQFADTSYEVEVSGDSATAYVPVAGARFAFARDSSSWQIAAFE